MLGLILTNEHVKWSDEVGALHHGVVVTLTDDELWAEVRELGQDDIVQLPTCLLHPTPTLRSPVVSAAERRYECGNVR